MYLSRIQLTDALAAEPKLANILRQNSYGVHQLLWDLFEDGSRHLFREENSSEQLNTQKKLPVYYVLSEQQPTATTAIFQVDSKPFQPRLIAGEKLAFRLRANPTVSRREEGKKNSTRHDVVMDAKYQHLLSACLEQGVLTPPDIEMTNTVNDSVESTRIRKVIRQKFSKKQLQDKLFACEAFADGNARNAFQQKQEHAAENAAQNWLIKRGEQHGFVIQSLQATGYQWHALMKPNGHRSAGFSSMDYEGVLTVVDTDAFLNMLKKGIGPAKGFGCGLMMIRRI